MFFFAFNECMNDRYEELDRKREGRLTSIIDQLLSTKATPSTFGDVIKAERRVKGQSIFPEMPLFRMNDNE